MTSVRAKGMEHPIAVIIRLCDTLMTLSRSLRFPAYAQQGLPAWRAICRTPESVAIARRTRAVSHLT